MNFADIRTAGIAVRRKISVVRARAFASSQSSQSQQSSSGGSGLVVTRREFTES